MDVGMCVGVRDGVGVGGDKRDMFSSVIICINWLFFFF